MLGVACVLSVRCVSGEIHVLSEIFFVGGVWVMCFVRILGVNWFLYEGNDLHVVYVLDDGFVLIEFGVFYSLSGGCN